MMTISILLMISQPLGSILIFTEDYILIKNNWCLQKGTSGIDNYQGINYFGGSNDFKKETFLQNHYYLQPHSQSNFFYLYRIFSGVQYKIFKQFESCLQLDDAIQTIDNSLFFTAQPVDLELSYFHSSKSAFFSLQVTKKLSCPDTWWGVFQIQIHISECQEKIDYCQPGSNSQWTILNTNLYFQPADWNFLTGSLENNYRQNVQKIRNKKIKYTYLKILQQNFFVLVLLLKFNSMSSYPIQLRSNCNINSFSRMNLHKQKYLQMILKWCGQQILESVFLIQNRQINFTVYNNYYEYNSICNSDIKFIYNIDIDTIMYYYFQFLNTNIHQNSYINQHKSDLLSITILLNESAGTNQVSIFDFVVYYQEQDTIQLPNQGCLNLIDQQCISCEEGWQYDSLKQNCTPICGNRIIQAYEECDDGNQISNDGCNNCKFQCSLDCLKCQFGECLKWSKIQNVDQFDTFSKIYDCYHSQGYYFDSLLNDCQSICGDQIITQEEECDDGNNQLNDGCNDCKFICSDNCLDCQFGKCYRCNQGYKIQQFKCISDCGDQIINVDEICDDGNNIRFDGCHQCQSSCQLQCNNCQNSLCISCLTGWNLIDGKCEQKCGDEQVALMSNEQCDDPNNNNCIDCLFQFCQDNCQVCNYNECVTCFFPFQMINGVCQPICGDSIVTLEFEQCDDGNDIQFDGCHQCQYSCSYGCQQCEQDNICKECDSNLFNLDIQTGKCKEIVKLMDQEIDSLNENDTNNQIIQCNPNYELVENICVNQCGNGQLSSNYEECDDGNNNGGDGCSSLCNLEKIFQCVNIENSLTICSFIKPPDFNLYSLSDKKNQIQIIEFTFTQQVKLNYLSNLEEIAIFKIIPQVQHDLIIIPKQNLTIQLNNPVYQIIIQFYQSIENPSLEIEISKFVITNQFDLELINFNKSISLGTPFVMSKTTKQQVVSIVKFNDAMMYSMVSIAGLALVTGNILMIINLLELLQSLSYIRYMQYQFPPNLRQFLETYTKVSMQPILDYFKVDELIAQLNGGFLPYKRKKSQKLISNLDLNQIYLMNAKSCYFSLLASFVTYLICSILASNFVNFKLFNSYPKNIEKISYLKYLQTFQTKVQQQCLKIRNDYFSLGIYQLYFTILHQLAFSTFLQFPDYNFETLFESFNSLNAMFALLLIMFVSFKVLSITSSRIRNTSRWKYFYQGSRCQFWALQFKSFQIFRVKFYIFIIVICMSYPEIQSILLSMQSLCYLIYLYKFRPMTSSFDLIKLMIRESFLMAIFCSFLLYSFDSTNDQLLLYGWIHIFLFSFILSTSLAVDMIEYFYKVYQNYQKRKIKQEEKQYRKYYDNPLQKFILIEQQHIVI